MKIDLYAVHGEIIDLFEELGFNIHDVEETNESGMICIMNKEGVSENVLDDLLDHEQRLLTHPLGLYTINSKEYLAYKFPIDVYNYFKDKHSLRELTQKFKDNLAFDKALQEIAEIAWVFDNADAILKENVKKEEEYDSPLVKDNIKYYYDVLAADTPHSMDALFLFIRDKLNRTLAHYHSQSFMHYYGWENDLIDIEMAFEYADLIVEGLEEGQQPSDEDVIILMSLMMKSHNWWD